MEDYQQGRRESSVISVQTVDSLSQDIRNAWRTIRKELEEVGITVAAFEENRDFIFGWLTHAMKTGAFEEQNASDSEVHQIPKSKYAYGGKIKSTQFNAPSVNVSTEFFADDEPPASHELSVSPSFPMPIIASRRPLTRPEVFSSVTTIPSKPIVACQRCDKSNIAYELHMHCKYCKGGDYDLCLQCWRLGRGCLNWYGFGKRAAARWHRGIASRAKVFSDSPFPHFLAGRRYLCVERGESPTS